MNFTRPSWLTDRILAVLAVVLALILLVWLLSRCSPDPRVDPKLGDQMIETVDAKADTTNERIDQAAPITAAKVMEPIKTHIRRTEPHVAKLRARTVAPAPSGAVHVPDDDFYSSVCQPGGLYEGRSDRGGECGKLAGRR